MNTLAPSKHPLQLLGLVVGLHLPFLAACGTVGDPPQLQAAQNDPASKVGLQPATESQTAPQETNPRISSQDQARQPLQISLMGYDRGDSDAPVKVLEISDFGCGYCRRFHEETFPTLLRIYVDAGFVEWKFIPFVLGMFPNGLEAATAAECAGEQDRFFPMQERLFTEQRAWRNSEDPYTRFALVAEEEGLDVERFNRCIAGGWRENQVRANIRLGQQAGARGTPLFLVDGRPIPGALPLEDFRSVLDAALIQRGITPPAR